MELTGQGLLCDYAEVSGGKLFITGAGISQLGTVTTDPPHPVSVALAIVVRIPWGKTNQQHRLVIELLSEIDTGPAQRVPLGDQVPEGVDQSLAGTIVALFNAGRAPTMLPGEETLMPVALPMQGLPLPRLGSYFFSISIDGTEVDRVSFRVASLMTAPGIVAPGQIT
jgi:hypothetical protein